MSVTVDYILEKAEKALRLALKNAPCGNYEVRQAISYVSAARKAEPPSRPPMVILDIGNLPDVNSGLIHLPESRRYPHRGD